MSEWQPIESAPMDGRRIIIRLSNGRECEAEYWEGPPGMEEAWGGWALDALAGFLEGTCESDIEAKMIGWKPLTNGDTSVDD